MGVAVWGGLSIVMLRKHKKKLVNTFYFACFVLFILFGGHVTSLSKFIFSLPDSKKNVGVFSAIPELNEIVTQNINKFSSEVNSHLYAKINSSFEDEGGADIFLILVRSWAETKGVIDFDQIPDLKSSLAKNIGTEKVYELFSYDVDSDSYGRRSNIVFVIFNFEGIEKQYGHLDIDCLTRLIFNTMENMLNGARVDSICYNNNNNRGKENKLSGSTFLESPIGISKPLAFRRLDTLVSGDGKLQKR